MRTYICVKTYVCHHIFDVCLFVRPCLCSSMQAPQGTCMCRHIPDYANQCLFYPSDTYLVASACAYAQRSVLMYLKMLQVADSYCNYKHMLMCMHVHAHVCMDMHVYISYMSSILRECCVVLKFYILYRDS